MNHWLISDTHFNHTKLEEWGGRSGDWQETLWKGIEAIPEGDVLIHLGDICIGNDMEIHERIKALKCRKILIRGNHDKKSVQWYLEHGWDFVCDGMELIFHGHYLYLSHRPTPAMYHFTYNIHGHTHGNLHRSEEYFSYHDPAYHMDISPEMEMEVLGAEKFLVAIALSLQSKTVEEIDIATASMAVKSLHIARTQSYIHELETELSRVIKEKRESETTTREEMLEDLFKILEERPLRNGMPRHLLALDLHYYADVKGIKIRDDEE